MKNILMLTSVYPSEENPRGFTPVVHYFTREWVKMGYNVKVIHNQTKFPALVYLAPKFIRNYLESKLGFGMPNYKMTSDKKYNIEDVNVHRIPLFRVFPKVKFLNFNLNKQIRKIIKSNNKDNFTPDVILSHWSSPQLPLIIGLKKHYDCLSSIVFHSGVNMTVDNFDLISQIDVIGFRSRYIKNAFFNVYNFKSKTFMCFSGINEDGIVKMIRRKKKEKIKSFIFAGNLIKRKFPDVVINSFINLNDTSRELIIVGDGPERENLYKIATGSHLSNNIQFLGHIDRINVLKQMEKSDCFIMISKNEIFGLVYIEAMAKGCFVIASRSEGIDGVIIHGYNGFLCKAGDFEELNQIINQLDNMTIEEKNNISQNAINTALEMTEYKVAKHYINKVLE